MPVCPGDRTAPVGARAWDMPVSEAARSGLEGFVGRPAAGSAMAVHMATATARLTEEAQA